MLSTAMLDRLRDPLDQTCDIDFVLAQDKRRRARRFLLIASEARGTVVGPQRRKAQRSPTPDTASRPPVGPLTSNPRPKALRHVILSQ